MLKFLRPAWITAWLTLMVLWVGGLYGLYLLYVDTRPAIANVVAWSKGEHEPGDFATLYWRYDRDFSVPMEILERWLICSDRVVRSVLPVLEMDDVTPWPPGKNQLAQVEIQLPLDVPPGVCTYQSRVRYQRIFLPDQILRMPPVGVAVRIKDDGRLQQDKTF